jgi:hypothetical protein
MRHRCANARAGASAGRSQCPSSRAGVPPIQEPGPDSTGYTDAGLTATMSWSSIMKVGRALTITTPKAVLMDRNERPTDLQGSERR